MLRKFTLLRSQRNRVFELLREVKLEPAEFAWTGAEIAGSILVSRLNYHEGAFYFQFSSHEVNAWCVLCPGMYRNLDHEYPRTWEEQEGVFRKWTSFLTREIQVPDFWEEMAKFRLALGFEPDEAVNEPISSGEADRIAEALSHLVTDIETHYRLTVENGKLLRERCAYLDEAARRVRSRDWVYMSLGVWASLPMALHLSEEQTPYLWELVRGEMGPYVHPATARSEPVQAKRSILGTVLGRHAEDPAHVPE